MLPVPISNPDMEKEVAERLLKPVPVPVLVQQVLVLPLPLPLVVVLALRSPLLNR
jgi:hypothetical protein